MDVNFNKDATHFELHLSLQLHYSNKWCLVEVMIGSRFLGVKPISTRGIIILNFRVGTWDAL